MGPNRGAASGRDTSVVLTNVIERVERGRDVVEFVIERSP
jgi:hypothetical protein